MGLGVDYQMAESVRQRDEVAFRVDDGLLHPWRTLFEQPTQQMGFAGTRIPLNQQTRRQQFLEVHSRRSTARRLSHLDRNGHVSTQNSLQRRRLNNPIAASRAFS